MPKRNRIQITTAHQPAGVVACATPEAAVITVWAGDHELIAVLDPDAAAEVAAILTKMRGYHLTHGHVTHHAVPAIAYTDPRAHLEQK